MTSLAPFISATGDAKHADIATGLLVEARCRPGHSLVCKVTSFRGLVIVRHGDEAEFVTEQASSLLVAYYSAAVLANGWEPFDQPVRSAYLPLSFSDIDTMECAAGGAALVEKLRRLRSAPLRLRASLEHVHVVDSPAGAAEAVAAEFAKLGVNADDRAKIATFISPRLEWLNQSLAVALTSAVA